MNKIDALLVKINSFEKKANDLDLVDDATRDARQALNLSGNKYPKDATAEGVMPDGSKVRLLSAEEAAKQGTFHRIQIQCRHCQKWIPAGRIGQHKDACFKRHDKAGYENLLDKKKQIQELREKYRKSFGSN